MSIVLYFCPFLTNIDFFFVAATGRPRQQHHVVAVEGKGHNYHCEDQSVNEFIAILHLRVSFWHQVCHDPCLKSDPEHDVAPKGDPVYKPVGPSLIILVLLEQPADSHPKLGNFYGHNAHTTNKGEVMEAEAEKHDGDGEDVVHVHGEVEPAFALGQELHGDHVHEEVGC